MHPIISALKHHKTAVVLVVLEIALTCAIISNALFLIGDQLAGMSLTTGVDDDRLIWMQSDTLPSADHLHDTAADAQEDLVAIRGIPGVEAAVQINSLPLVTGMMAMMTVHTRPGDAKSPSQAVAIYDAGAGALGALGIKLEEGRDFLPEEYAQYAPFGSKPMPAAVIITRALARKLWPGQDAIGKPIYWGSKESQVTRVVGIAAHLLNPNFTDRDSSEYNLFLPAKTAVNGLYVLRTEPAARGTVLRALPGTLARINPDRIITDTRTYAQSVRDYFHDARALIWLLAVVIAALLALTALGVVGLSSFWVQQRTHQIGIRRAIGATRGDILVYFQVENFLIVSVGIAIGLLLAVALNLLLMKHYELPRLPLHDLPIGAVMLWMLGQLAVLGPALRAAAVAPVVATRSA